MKKIKIIKTIAGGRIEQSRKSGKRITSHKHALLASYYPIFIYLSKQKKPHIFTKRLIIMFSRLTLNK